MVKSRQWLLANKPTGSPVLTGDKATFQLVDTELPALKDDELLVKLLYLSNDPAQRGWISANVNPERLYTVPVKQGTPMHARGLAEVVDSKSAKFSKGDVVIGSTGWSEYAVLPASGVQAAPELPNGLSKTHYLGALGLTGLTAQVGLDVVRTSKDDIVLISGAAGATGSMAVQIAKKLIGCKKVIGIAGSDDKCKWVEGLGADLCLNYKSSSFYSDLKKATPGPDEFANVYFDNVGGDLLDKALSRMARGGRAAACGAISNYNATAESLQGVKNWFEVISMRLEIHGFIVLDHAERYPAILQGFKKGLEDGKLQVEGGEHLVKAGFEDVPKTWMHLFDGTNTGKLITAIQ